MLYVEQPIYKMTLIEVYRKIEKIINMQKNYIKNMIYTKLTERVHYNIRSISIHSVEVNKVRET